MTDIRPFAEWNLSESMRRNLTFKTTQNGMACPADIVVGDTFLKAAGKQPSIQVGLRHPKVCVTLALI